MEWKKFADFFHDMGVRPEGTTLDRIDVNGHYNKANCRWSTPTVQQNNVRRNVNVEYKGEVKSLAFWAREKGMVYSTLRNRILKGWDVERALELGTQKSGIKYRRVFVGERKI